MKKLLYFMCLLAFIALPFSVYAGPPSTKSITVQEADGDPKGFCRVIKFPNGSLTITGGTGIVTYSGGGSTTDIDLADDGDFNDYDIHAVDGLYGVDDDVYIDLGTDGYIDIIADTAVRSTSLWDFNPAGVGSSDIINITPSAAITTATSIWHGIHILGAALDPSAAATDSEIYGAKIDMSGVLRTYIEDVEAIHLAGTLPTAVAGQMEPGIAAHLDGKFRVDYNATQSAAAETLTVIDVIIDTTGVTAGHIHAIDVAPSGGGSPTALAALGTHTGVAPIHKHTGAFASPGANYACEQTSNGTVFDDNVDGETIFVADNDTIMVGSVSTFDEIEIILGTPATKDTFLRFYYNTAINTWVRFFPGDDTEGMTQSGSIRFDNPAGWTNDGDPDAGGGAADAGYWIKIERTRVATPGTIIITTAKILSATEYYWDEDGNILVANLAGDTYGSDGSISDVEFLRVGALGVTPWTNNEVSDTLQASLFVGTGSSSNAIDLATAEVAGVLPVANIHGDIARDAEADTLCNATTTDHSIARFNGTDNKTIQGSGIIIDDSDNVSGVASLETDAINDPYYTFLDLQNPGTDKEIARIGANFLSGGDGAEDGSVWLESMLGGTERIVWHWDSDTEAVTEGDSVTGEDIIRDYDTGTANQVTYSSNSGVTELNFSAFNMVTTGIIAGGINHELADGAVTVGSADAHDAYGTMWISDNAAPTLTMPATLVMGMCGCLIEGQGRTDVLILDANAGDKIVLDGVAGNAGETVASTGAAGDKICWTVYDGEYIYITSTSGTWGVP